MNIVVFERKDQPRLEPISVEVPLADLDQLGTTLNQLSVTVELASHVLQRRGTVPDAELREALQQTFAGYSRLIAKNPRP